MNPSELRVLFRDEQVIAIDKPAGLLSVPGRAVTDVPAISQLVRALAPEALPVHRLDRDTSGVLIFAIGRAAHRALNSSFETRRAEKRYLALCSGNLTARMRCEVPLIPARNGGMHAGKPGDRGVLSANTEFLPLERFEQATLIEALPRTGRTHQIRVHLQAIGHALLLDPRYGNPDPIAARQLNQLAVEGNELVLTRTPLHASALRVPHPSGKGYLQLESPTPPDLAKCLDLLRAQRRRS